MARRTGESARRIYEAAAQFVAEGLGRDGSLFTPGKAIWTATVAEDLDARFVRRPDESADAFLPKFQRQLAGAPAETIQFAAELIFVHLLISDQLKRDTKSALIHTVLAWSPSPIDLPLDLEGALDGGLCNAGQGFLINRPFLLMFLVGFVQRWKQLSDEGRRVALADPWKFKQLVFEVPARAAQTQQHALLHLVFPDSFESIVSGDHKHRIAKTFGHSAKAKEEDVDRQLLAIRASLAPSNGPAFNFWEPAIKAQWLPTDGDTPNPPPAERRYWVEKTLVSGRLAARG